MDFFHDLQNLGPGPLAAVIAAFLGCFILVGAVYLWIVKSTRRARRNFSDEAQKAIGFARIEAEKMQSAPIDPTHLLLGLLHVPASTIQNLLPKEGHDSIRDEIKEHVAGGAI